jgi:microcystin-dependent protein
MSEPFLAEIRIMSFNFAPKGWAMCNGQLMQINQNQALFSLLGTTFGGDGRTTFALPNLRGDVPIHFGNSHTIGEQAGTTSVTISIQTLTQHIHFVSANKGVGTKTIPTGNLLSKAPANAYGPATALVAMNPASVGNTGGSQAHNNMMPYLVLNFCIALVGIFPSQN